MTALRWRKRLYFVVVLALALAFFASGEEALAQRRVPLRFATSNVGSYGYSVGSILADVLSKELPSQYVVTVHPYPSTTAAMKAVMDGEAEFAYTADVGMFELYEGMGPYEGFRPRQGWLVHTWYVYPMETFLAVPRNKAADFNSWSDFDGVPGFYTPAGFMNWLNLQRIFAALDMNFNHVEIDSSLVADSFRAGAITAAGAYTTAGRSLPTYWREAELQIEVDVINPSPEEIERLRAAGLAPRLVNPADAFTRDVGVDEIFGVPILFAYNVRKDMDADLVYDVLSAFYEHAATLPSLDAGFGPLAADFIGMQVSGVAANPNIAVHPGLARFLQEHGQWDDGWTIAD